MRKRLTGTTHDAAYKKQLLASARKAQAHLAHVVALLEQDRYCVDVLQQALAVQGLWKGVIRRVFANHVRTCFQAALAHGTESEQRKALDEVIRVMEMSERS
jgi:DNA-binding FrmR family transcriptional regulator